MSAPVERTLVESLLDDGSLSYREIARQAGCSDWTVRRIARDLAGDPTPMKRRRPASDSEDEEQAGPAGWGVLVGLAAFFGGLIWLATRRAPPPQI